MGIWDEFIDPLKKVADDTAAGYQAPAPTTAAPVAPGPGGPLPEPKYGPGDAPFAKPASEPTTPVGDASPLEAPTNFGTEAEFGSGSARTEQAGFPIQAPLASEVKSAGGGGAPAAAGTPMAVAPANINYAPVGGKAAFDTAYGELPLAEQDALGGLHNTTADGLKAQAESKAEEANQLAQMAENSRLREEQRSKALMDHVANYTRMADQMAAQRFDAGRYWKNPGNVLAAFSMSLLPLAGVSPEKAIGLVNDAVQRDWSAQQIDYERAQNRAAAELSTIGQLRSIYGDERAAEDAFRAQSYKAMAAKAQSVALRGQSEEQRKLATLLASQYATQAAQSQARANATLYQGAHIAPAQLVGAQVREGEKAYTDPAVNALYGRKDGIPSPPAPGEAPGDNPATGMPDHPPTAEERNAAAVQAALARFRGKPVPPEVQSVLDASKRVASGTKELLSPLTDMLGIGGPDAEPEAAPAAAGAGSTMARARANLGLPPRAQGQAAATGAKRMEAREIPDVESRTVVSAAERIYGGQLPNNLADKLAQKYGSKVTNVRPTDLTPDKKTGNLPPEVMAQLQKDIEYAKSERGLADQAYKNEETAARGGLVDAQKYGNQVVGVQAASDVNVPLKVVKVRSEGGRPIYEYVLGHNGRPMLDDSATPEQRKKYDAYFTKLTEESRKEIAEYEKRVDQKWKGEGHNWPVSLRSARTQQQLLLKKFGGDPAKVDEALGFLRTGSFSVKDVEFDVQSMAQALRKLGVTATPDDVLKYKRTMQSLELKFSSILSGQAMSEKEIGRHRRILSYDAPFREQALGTESELSDANQALEDMKRSLSDTARAILNKRDGVGYGRQATPTGAYSTPGLR